MYPQPLEFGGRHEDSRGEAEGGGGGCSTSMVDDWPSFLPRYIEWFYSCFFLIDVGG